jgi:hypothetical protein
MLHVYIVTKNEEVMLPHAVKHYRTRFPGCPITVYDNNSTDKTVELARGLGCTVRRWYTKDDIQDNPKLAILKSECWKQDYVDDQDPPWVIVVDADEWLDMWESDLVAEDALGSVIITTEGFAAVGRSHRLDLADIDLHAIRFGMAAMGATRPGFVPKKQTRARNLYSKSVCFKRGRNGLSAMNYTFGAHSARPVPMNATRSANCYVLKHMDAMGERYLTDKHQRRFDQAANSRKLRLSTHYRTDPQQIIKIYRHMLNSSADWNALSDKGHVRLQCSMTYT